MSKVFSNYQILPYVIHKQRELWQLSYHDAAAIREAHGELARRAPSGRQLVVHRFPNLLAQSEAAPSQLNALIIKK